MSLPWLLRVLTVQALMHPRRVAAGLARELAAEASRALAHRASRPRRRP